MSISTLNNNYNNEPERRDIKINSQESATPEKSVFNLNDYYNQGYKKDDQNEQEASVMREDILAIYNISFSDSDKDTKLLRIYEQILSDNSNSALFNYCQSNGIPTEYNEDNAQEFISGVSCAMAHMSHDGSSVGDNIKLGEVDFSGISDETENGFIETIKTQNGSDSIIYGENNQVLKIVSYQSDALGLTTISVYSDADKSKLLSKDTAYRLEKSETEIKFKFSSGNKNTVDIKDNGNNLTVKLSKGVLNSTYTVEKTADGTYSLDGKQYFTLEELASDFNTKEFQTSTLLDGEINASSQGKVGDCGLVSAINSLSCSEYGRDAIKNAVSVDLNGNVTVNFKGIDRAYTISAQELSNSNFATGDYDVRAIEMAYEKMMEEVHNGTLVKNDYPPYYIFGTEETNYNANRGVPLSTGTYPSAVYYMLTGIRCTKWAYQSDEGKFSTLDAIEKDGSKAMSVAYLPERSSANGNINMSIQNTSKNVQDAFGNTVKLYDFHHYAVKESDTLPNGERIVTIINPWDSTEEIVLNQNTLLSAFNAVFDVDYTSEAGKYKFYAA